ncbi:MAG: alpha/beta hydrolase [Myxococcaceae bacterium]|nr:alpha/beta hydrolase [Myxococcaceae bacterium]
MGPTVLFVHGSAADRTTWTIQVAGLRSKLRLITYDRRGTGASELPPGAAFFRIEQHADDAAALIETYAEGGPVLAVGSSFGAVVVLDLARRRPELLRGAMLLEPPLARNDTLPPIPEDFLARYDTLARERSGPGAAEFFLRSVLGDAAFERMPKRFQERSMALHAQIRQDIAALGAYPVRYAELATVQVPILLLGGDRSAPFYRHTLHALHDALGNARLEFLAGAGHMMHADVHRRFNQRLLEFLAEVSL